jgi:hypothetical protein
MIDTNPEEKEQMLKAIPMARIGEPEEMAEAVIWLCSNSASFITGHVMPIDGGLTATQSDLFVRSLMILGQSSKSPVKILSEPRSAFVS